MQTITPVNDISARLVPLFRQGALETLANLRETIRLAQVGGRELTTRRIDQEMLMMAHLRSLADQIDQSLQARALNLRTNARSSARWAELSATIGCAGVFAILLGSNIHIKHLLSTRDVLNERLAVANEDLQQFIYAASHDLQEPLRTLRIFADSLESKIKAHRPFDRDLYHLRTAAEQMSALLSDLLTYTEVGSDSFPSGEMADMRKIAGEIVEELSELAARNKARVDVQELALVPMAGNHARHLLRNLISNAIRYHKPNVSPVITVSGSRDGKRRIVCVKDNGIGIQPEYHQQIFGIFKRLHTRTDYPGTGLVSPAARKSSSDTVAASGSSRRSAPARISSSRFPMSAPDRSFRAQSGIQEVPRHLPIRSASYVSALSGGAAPLTGATAGLRRPAPVLWPLYVWLCSGAPFPLSSQPRLLPVNRQQNGAWVVE